MNHPICELCEARLYHLHPLSPNVKINTRCGHLFCGDCIDRYVSEHPGLGCPNCGAAILVLNLARPASVNRAIEPAETHLKDVYVPTSADASDTDWPRQALANPHSVYLDRRLSLAQDALDFAKQEHDMFQSENTANASTTSHLLGQLEATRKDQADYEKICGDLRDQLMALSLKRQELEAQVEMRTKEILHGS
ncbi:uncharacterized protein B0H18DRAFT_1011393 [Fomitopsis serialis]|uniref:uncharacterized protein n=1 Tax=Fomitopsis serialis TaxID=139415 RepID=UPI0020080040|nr:uncharacterized protein B0H18DRAFT_1011393 [Neoantrodia serialis]KAH9924815.1 hypothetical protein B0H18DRAFT_1011393 [Neoantrodia serialis]